MSTEFIELKRELYRAALAPLPFETRIKLDYFRRHRRWPNIENPKKHSEKMVRRILRESDPLFTKLCSKQDMKVLAVENAGYTSLAIADTLWFGQSTEVMDAVKNAAELGHPWVLKPNNLGGGIIMLPDSNWNSAELEEHTSKLLRESRRVDRAYRRHAPIAWRSSRPGFIIEQRIGDIGGMPTDYKVHVFNGVPKIISVYKDRSASLSVQHYDVRGTYLFGRNDTGMYSWPGEENVERLLSAASLLSCGLPYTRVDFYLDNGDLWFGEISPYGSMDGLSESPNLDREMGALWEL